MKKILKIVVPSILMLISIYLMRDGKAFLNGLFLLFPIMYVIIGIICTNLKKELLFSLLLTSVVFLIPVNLYFDIGGACIVWVLIYIALGSVVYFIKNAIKKKQKVNNWNLFDNFISYWKSVHKVDGFLFCIILYSLFSIIYSLKTQLYFNPFHI